MHKCSKIFFSVVLAVGILSGCAQQRTISTGVFPEAEYKALPKEGTGIVKGQIFLKTVGGDVKYGAGIEVSLIPATSYSASAWEAYQTNSKLTPPDPRVKEYSIRTQSDGTGNFEFRDVPPGRYYIGGEVTWQIPTQFGLSRQGGWVMSQVTAKNGSESKVIITK
ncbi:hypothetical protein [Pseudomonas mohnii]